MGPFNSRKGHRSIMIERTSVVAWASEGVGEMDYKGQEETSGDDGYDHYPGCGLQT